jgi:hypothetical protein
MKVISTVVCTCPKCKQDKEFHITKDPLGSLFEALNYPCHACGFKFPPRFHIKEVTYCTD